MTEQLTVVLAVYRKAEQTRYFRALSESLVKHDQRRIVLVTYDKVADEAEVEALRAIPGVSLMRVIIDRANDPDFAASAESPLLDNPASLMAWARGVQLVAIGQPFVALDLATLVLRPLGEVIPRMQPRHFTLALAQGLTATGRPRVLPGVLYGVGGPLTVRTMDSWWREARNMLGRGDHEAVIRTYGSALSAAWMLSKSRADEGGGAIFGTIPKGWVSTDEHPSDEAGIVRFVNGEEKK